MPPRTKRGSALPPAEAGAAAASAAAAGAGGYAPLEVEALGLVQLALPVGALGQAEGDAAAQKRSRHKKYRWTPPPSTDERDAMVQRAGIPGINWLMFRQRARSVASHFPVFHEAKVFSDIDPRSLVKIADAVLASFDKSRPVPRDDSTLTLATDMVAYVLATYRRSLTHKPPKHKDRPLRRQEKGEGLAEVQADDGTWKSGVQLAPTAAVLLYPTHPHVDDIASGAYRVVLVGSSGQVGREEYVVPSSRVRKVTSGGRAPAAAGVGGVGDSVSDESGDEDADDCDSDDV